MNDLLDFESLKVSIASSELIKAWSFGEVTKPETINYRTLKSEKDGLFSENIFGPTKDYECYCGKYKRIRYRGVICDKCGVEVTQSKVRRERMGHITLAAPVAHSWFVKGAPSKLSLVLDLTMKNLEAVIYFASYLVIDVDEDKKTAAFEKLEKAREDKKAAAEKVMEGKIAELEKEHEKALAELKKSNKEAEKFEMAAGEVTVKQRHEIAKMREGLSLEMAQLDEIYSALANLVKSVNPLRLLSEDEYYKLDEYGVGEFLTVGMGAEALLQVLRKIDVEKLSAELRVEVAKSTGQRHIKATKRLRIIEGMKHSKLDPAAMILTILPVLPPDLRPMVQLPGGRFATSDLNDLYRRVINRNNRLKKLIDLGAPEIILRNEKRMLQEAVDSLIDANIRQSRRVGHQLRSLSDMLRGKQGRFRQNLLGKRVDYSGRSVIIVGPQLKLNQVGVPKEMALEMFKPFVLREVMVRGLASNVKGAKNIMELRIPEVWDILEQVTEKHPVLINRAPTLHRLGFQAFYPVLIEGNAIQIHPCICAGFNADFDGDQMALHVPLSDKARDEAEALMMAKENVLRPSDGSPVNVPNKEMALGSYFVTSVHPQSPVLDEKSKVYTHSEAILAYELGQLPLRYMIRAQFEGQIYDTTVGRIIFNQRLPKELQFVNEPVNAKGLLKIMMEAFKRFDLDKVAALVDRIKEIGFWGATQSGMSLAITDNKIIPEKKQLIADGDKEIAELEDNVKKGLITDEERRASSMEVWTRVGSDIVRRTFAAIEPDNPIQIIINSGGARASTAQIAQTSGMRGFSVDATGKIVELPTKSNYREGLGVFEYFTSCRGARKGVADRALRTADAGYLTRRLVDVAHDMIIRMEDCGTKQHLVLDVPRENPNSVTSRFLGRKVVAKIVDPATKKVIVEAGDFIQEEALAEIMKSTVEEISVRSALTCEARIGLCSNCYGLDLITRKSVAIGVPVGVVAAQSIGEPGTQLTMRTFHSGGVVGADITQGLPRVEELFEARTPKVISPMSELAGKVTITDSEEGRVIRVRTTSKPHEEREYVVPMHAQLLVEEDQLISAGTQLIGGFLDAKEVLRVRGLRDSQRYVVDEVRKVYEGNGVTINEKHFEVIVRKMSDKVRVETQGDTALLPGEIIDRNRFEIENAKVLAEGGEPATAGIVVLGITRASLQTESFLSAASFQETTTVLADAAVQGKVDHLIGLKENVIIGRLIPTSPERAGVTQ